MQEVAIQVVGAQALQRLLAMFERALTTRIFGNDFRDQKDFVAAPLDRLADQRLGLAGPVELGRVDVGEAQIERRPHCRNRRVGVTFFEIPSAKPDFRHVNTGRTKDVCR